MIRCLPLLLLLVQAEDFQKRVKVDGRRVSVDDRVLFEGAWQKADVALRELPGGWAAIVVTVDGQERVRVPVPSLAKPVAWPPLDAGDLRPTLKRLTETLDGKKTLAVLVMTEKGGEAEIYRGEPADTRIERTPDAFLVLLDAFLGILTKIGT